MTLLPPIQVETIPSPGAYTSTQGPVLLNVETVFFIEIAPTVMALPLAPPLDAGEELHALLLSFPAATTA